MKKTIIYLHLILFLFTCNPAKEEVIIEEEKIEEQEKYVPLKRKELLEGDIRNEKYQYYYINVNHPKLIKGNKILVFEGEEDEPIYIDPLSVKDLWVSGKDSKDTWAINKFPDVIFKFKNLERLHFGFTSMEELPANITDLKKMRYIDLQNSWFQKLPDSIGQMKTLQEVLLLETQIKTLPQSFTELGDLRRLHIGVTNIESLPEGMEKLTKLQEFVIFNKRGELSESLKLQVDSLKVKMPWCNFHTG